MKPALCPFSVWRHLTAVIDGVIHDTHDPSRDGTRSVYGYYSQPDAQPTPTERSTSL